LEDLKVPRVREDNFHPGILSYRKRASPELSEAILALYSVGVSTRSTRKILAFLEGVYGAFYSPQSVSCLTEVTLEQVKVWQENL
jgi:putative transposase